MEANLWMVRVFRALGAYTGREEAAYSATYEIDGLIVKISTGLVPSKVREAAGALNSILEGVLSGGTPVVIQELPELSEEHSFYSTIVVQSAYEVEESATRAELAYHWYEPENTKRQAVEFTARANAEMDYTVGSLIGLLGCDVVGSVAYSSRCFLSAANKPVQPILRFDVGSASVLNSKSAMALRSDRIVDVDFGGRRNVRQVSNIGRWLTVAVREPDPMKQFLWAYAGLEVICNAARKRCEEELLSLIANRLDNITDNVARNLIYPTPDDEATDPWRSIIYKFTVLALVTGGSSTGEDVEEFRKVSKFRNRIHGQEIQDEMVATHSDAALELLRKYAPLVVARIGR